jgi:hypothetical protein
VPEDHLHDVSGTGAQRHPNSDLARPLSDRVCHHAVNADRRQHGGNSTEDSEKKDVEPQKLRLLAQVLLDSPEISGGSAGIDLRHGALHALDQLERIAGSSKQEIHASPIRELWSRPAGGLLNMGHIYGR